MTPGELQTHLAGALEGCELRVSGDGSHFEVEAVGDCFQGLNRVRRQQLVYRALGDLISSGAVHAVQIRALTPQEAAGGG